MQSWLAAIPVLVALSVSATAPGCTLVCRRRHPHRRRVPIVWCALAQGAAQKQKQARTRGDAMDARALAANGLLAADDPTPSERLTNPAFACTCYC